jgi:hypothetical protein
MGLFGRKTYTLPEMWCQRLVQYGEYLTAQNPRFNTDLLVDLKVMDFSRSQPSEFLAQLVGRLDRAEPAGYVGACEMIHHLFGMSQDDPNRWLIIDRALDYLHSLSIPWRKLKDYQQERWTATHGAGTW